MYVDGSGSLWSLQSHNLFIRRDASEKLISLDRLQAIIQIWLRGLLASTLISPLQDPWRRWWRIEQGHSHGIIRAPCAHCPEFLHTHWGGSLVKLLSLTSLLLFHGCAYRLNWVRFALAKHKVLFLTPSSAHQFFMAYCTHQLKMGNFSLDTRSMHY